MPLHVAIENFIHDLRYRQVLPHLEPCERLGDLGCGDAPRFLRKARRRAKHCWGLDLKTPESREGNVTLTKGDITKPLPFSDGFFDQVTLLAVIEHIEDPLPILREAHRCMRHGGRLIVTTPSRLGIRIHDVIRRLGLVRDVEEGEHKDFGMSLGVLRGWIERAGFKVAKAYSFEFGINLIVVAEKP